MEEMIFLEAEDYLRENEEKVIDTICIYHQLAESSMDGETRQKWFDENRSIFEDAEKYVNYAFEIWYCCNVYDEFLELMYNRLWSTPMKDSERYYQYLHFKALSGLYRGSGGHTITRMLLSCIPENRAETIWRKMGAKMYNVSPGDVEPESVWKKSRRNMFQRDLEEYLGRDDEEDDEDEEPEEKQNILTEEEQYNELLEMLDAISVESDDELVETYRVLVRNISKDEMMQIKTKFKYYELFGFVLYASPEDRRRILDFEEAISVRMGYINECLEHWNNTKQRNNIEKKLLPQFFREYNCIKWGE